MMKFLRVLLKLFLVLVIGIAALLVLLDANTPKRNLYLIPEGYHGWLCTTFLAAGKPPLPVEDGYRVVKFD